MGDYVAGGVPERLVPRTTDARNAHEATVAAGRRRGLRDDDEQAGRGEDRELPRVVGDSPARPADRAASLPDPVADDVLAGPGERRDDDADPLHHGELTQREPADARGAVRITRLAHCSLTLGR